MSGRASGTPQIAGRTGAGGFLLPLVLLLLVCVAASPGRAESENPPPAASSEQQSAPDAEIDAAREKIAGEIDELQRRFAELGPGGGDAAVALREELDLLERIDRVQARRLEALQRARQLEEAESQLELKLAAGPSSPIAKPPPYPLALADAIADALEGQVARRLKVEAALQAAEEALGDARRRLDDRERARRQAREALETASDPASSATLARRLRVAELESRLARARHELAEQELANARSDLALQEQSEEFARSTLAWIERNLALDRAELAEPLAELEKREFDLKRALDQAGLELASSERLLDAAQQRLEATRDPDAALLAEVEARRLARQAAQRRMALLGEQVQRLEARRELLERRYQALARLADRDQLREWQQQIEASLEEAGREQRLDEARLAELRRDLAEVRERAETAVRERQPGARWLEEQERALAELVGLYEQDLASLREQQVLGRRALGVVGGRAEQVSFTERVGDALGAAGAVWTTEIFAVEDRPITVGKIVTALLLVLLGILLSRVASRLIGRLLMRRAAIDAGAAQAFQGLAFYFFTLLFFLFALRVVNIPLTAFTVLGGAFAIGVGFGSQNIVNNFISGLILMAERPIKVGDIVEIDGAQGRIERIGPRSTRVRTLENIHLIVPNSAFLEKNVINWTLSDDIVRAGVDVGVVYGSPTREVDRLIRKVLAENERILENPAPAVLFTEFGDNALNFRASFWIRVRDPADRRRVESAVRFRIDDEFRAAGLVIAFPQRDVHLDTVRPLEVRVLEPGTGKNDG